MNSRISTYAAAVPDELTRPESAHQELAGLTAKLAQRPVPTSSLRRAFSLGTLPARVGAGWVVTWLRGAFAGEEERTRLSNERRLRAGLAVLGRMGHLRGAVMKVGQIITNYPDLVPDEIAEPLACLHFEAPPMHYSLLAESVRKELGSEPEELFAKFDRQAFAAASLGQVHRASTRTGEDVAVKVQYPGIATTIRSDFRNLGLLMSPMRLGTDGANLKEQCTYLRDMLLLEVDYESEADFLDQARAALSDLDEVVVPRPLREYSTKRVLAMEHLEGRHLTEWLADDPPTAERNRVAELLVRATTRLFFAERLCWGDPHPGNVLILNDGRLGLLDFGSCRRFDAEEWHLMELGVHSYRQDGAAIREMMRIASDLSPAQAADEKRMAYLESFARWYWEPMSPDAADANGLFDFRDPDYLRRGMQLFGEGSRRRYTRAHPVSVYNARFLFGIRALLHQLGAQIPASRINAEELARAGL